MTPRGMLRGGYLQTQAVHAGLTVKFRGAAAWRKISLETARFEGIFAAPRGAAHMACAAERNHAHSRVVHT